MAANITKESLTKAFNKARKNEDYTSLGNKFFHLFVTLEKGDELREHASKLWRSLTAQEQLACEGCD